MREDDYGDDGGGGDGEMRVRDDKSGV